MKMAGIMLRIMRFLCNTGKAVIMYSGLCILQRLFKIRKRWGVCNCIDKKRQYWPRGVYVEGINE